jgi:NitT/TauT family transport system ATP-binding protein
MTHRHHEPTAAADDSGHSDHGAGRSPLPDAALRFRDVAKRFPDGTLTLTGVSVDVAKGEFVSVVGPSGCGKTTLLRIASGLTRVTSGIVEVHADNVGYVFQDPTLLPWRSVRKNVELLAELERMSKAERRQRAVEAIKLVGLTGFERHRPRALSGGMRMRVSLARSLVLQPDIFLFDEPFGAVDEMTRERLNDELLQLFLARRFAALFVTHSVSEAVYLSTRVIVMSPRPGTLLGDFPVPFDYPRQPQLRFTDEFAHVAAQVSRRLRDAEP